MPCEPNTQYAGVPLCHAHRQMVRTLFIDVSNLDDIAGECNLLVHPSALIALLESHDLLDLQPFDMCGPHGLHAGSRATAIVTHMYCTDSYNVNQIIRFPVLQHERSTNKEAVHECSD